LAARRRRKEVAGRVNEYLYILAFCQSPVAALTQPPPVFIPYVINGIITSSLRVLSKIRGDSVRRHWDPRLCTPHSHARCHSVSGTTLGKGS
jgi:hypothetical protein